MSQEVLIVGSRVMHMIVSIKIAEAFQFQNESQFILGGIAPDAVLNKETSHFYAGDHDDFSRHINYAAFLKKYHTHPQQDYIAGYVTHLITDDLWLQGFYLPWLKNRLDADADMAQRYHGDFDLLNSKLINHYKIRPNVLPDLRSTVEHLPDLDEVRAQNIHQLLDALENDMCITDEKLNADLNVFTQQQMIGYIETAVQKSLMLLTDNNMAISDKIKNDKQ